MIWKGVHKRVNTEGLRLLSSESLAGKVGPWLASPNLTGRSFSTLTKFSLNDGSDWLRLNRLYGVVYAEHLPSFRESGSLVHVGQWVPLSPAPNKNLGLWVTDELPVNNISRLFVVTTYCWESSVRPVWLQWERTPGSLCLVSSRLYPMSLFPLLILLCVLLMIQFVAMSMTICWVLWALPANHWTQGKLLMSHLFTILPSVLLRVRSFLSASSLLPVLGVCIKDGWGVTLCLILSSHSSTFIPLRTPQTHSGISLTSRYNPPLNCDPLKFSLIPGVQVWDPGLKWSGIRCGGGMQFRGTNSICTIFGRQLYSPLYQQCHLNQFWMFISFLSLSINQKKISPNDCRLLCLLRRWDSWAFLVAQW